MTVLAARLFELANGIEQYNQSLMPPASDRPRPSFLKPFSPPVGAPIQPFVFYELELQFRNSLLEKYFYDKCENLYYCERDAGVFAPGQNEFTTLDNLEQLLYKYPAVTEQHISQIERVSWVTLGKAKAYNTSGVETFWAAMAYGENRVYIINQLRWDEQWLKNGHDKTNGRDLLPSSNVMWSPLSTCSECSSAYNRIISDLEAKGWVRLNEQGEYWYQARFVLPRNL